LKETLKVFHKTFFVDESKSFPIVGKTYVRVKPFDEVENWLSM